MHHKRAEYVKLRIMKKICVMCEIQLLVTAAVLTCDTLICGMCAIEWLVTAAVLTCHTLICVMCAIQWLATTAVLTCDTSTIRNCHTCQLLDMQQRRRQFFEEGSRQTTNHFHFMGIAVRAASCCHVISVMPLVLQTSPSDNLYWSKQLQIHYVTLRIGMWTVSGLFRRHTAELLKAKLNNAWPGWAASSCLSAEQKMWVEKRK